MNPTSATDVQFVDFASRYGWVILLIVILLRETLPRFLSVFIPARSAERQRQIDADSLIQQEDIRIRRELDERQVSALERVAENTEATRSAISAIQAYMVTTTSRLDRIEKSFESANRALSILLDRAEKKSPSPPHSSGSPTRPN